MNRELRGPLTNEFLNAALMERPQCVVIAADPAHRLEYSFGVDVLKFKPQIRDFVAALSAAGIPCGIETDYRHENILHAGDCGVQFVEIDASEYHKFGEHYHLAIEIANERGIQVAISGPCARDAAACIPEGLAFRIA